MYLFDNKNRSRTTPLRSGENKFDYYDQAYGEAYDKLRGLINSWFSETPEEMAHELICRMKSGEFNSALLELITHTLLKHLGYTVQIHPSIAGTQKQPDFLALKDGKDRFYVEATTINNSNDHTSHNNRESMIINALNRTTLPEGCHLSYTLIQSSPNSPKARQFAGQVEEWVSIEFNTIARDEFIMKQFEIEGWKIEISLLSSDSPNNIGNNVASHTTEGWFAPSKDLRRTLETKSAYYGRTFEAPFILAVANTKESFCRGQDRLTRALSDAVLGDEISLFELCGDGTTKKISTRKMNGFWHRRGKPHNQHISALLMMPVINLWSMRNNNPILVLNPWATRPLNESLLPLSRLTFKDGKWVYFNDMNLADILEIPNYWDD